MSELSPDGHFRLEITKNTEANGGDGGMGHDADDYFRHTVTAQVFDARTGASIFFKQWSRDYNANDQSSSGECPDSVTFSPDGGALIAKFERREEAFAL